MTYREIDFSFLIIFEYFIDGFLLEISGYKLRVAFKDIMPIFKITVWHE